MKFGSAFGRRIFYGILLFPWLVFAYGYSTAFDFTKASPTLYYWVFVASSWIFLGPTLTWLWDIRSRHFFKEIECRLQDDSDRAAFRSFFFKQRPLFHMLGAAYLALSLALFFVSFDELSLIIEFSSLIVFMTLFVLVVCGYYTGLGVAGVIFTVIVFMKFGNKHYRWSPGHSDGCGGFRKIGSFIVITTTFFSCGSVVVPAVLEISKISGPVYDVIAYGNVFLYAILIMISFLAPAFFLFFGLWKSKLKHLAAFEDEIDQRKIVDEKTGKLNYDNVVRVDPILNYIRNANEVSLFPFGPVSRAQIISSIALPVGLLYTQKAVGSLYDYISTLSVD